MNRPRFGAMPSTPQKDGDATETSINSPTRALQLWFGVHRADLLTSSAFGFSVNLALPSRFGHRDLGTEIWAPRGGMSCHQCGDCSLRLSVRPWQF